MQSKVTFLICEHILVGHLDQHVAIGEVQWVFAGELSTLLVTMPGDIGYWFVLLRSTTYLITCRPNMDEFGGENKKEKGFHPAFLPLLALSNFVLCFANLFKEVFLAFLIRILTDNHLWPVLSLYRQKRGETGNHSFSNRDQRKLHDFQFYLQISLNRLSRHMKHKLVLTFLLTDVDYL